MNWVTISCILCVFGCLKDFRPSESFVTDYLTGPWKNFTELEVNQDIYPVSTYSYFATLIVVFLITDFVRYKPIIILCGLSGSVTFTLIILGKTIPVLQVVEFFYGLILSAEVAYYTYIYAKVDKKHYQEVTSHTKAASLVGRCMAGIVAQLTVSFNLLDYHQLNYLTLSAYVIATIWAFFLPSVRQSIYFHPRNITQKEINTPTLVNDNVLVAQEGNSQTLSKHKLQSNSPEEFLPLTYKIKRAYVLLWKDFLQAYTNFHVVKWSAWWALSSCGLLQVTSYIQLLWQTAVNDGDKIYNGAADAIYAIIGAVTVFCVGKLQFNWSLLGDAVLSIFAFLEGILLLISSYSYNIWLLYAAYIAFGVIYHTMVTVASFEVAKHISEDSYGLIFGLNIFFALLSQSLLTLIVVNGNLNLDTRAQYCVYGGYFITLAVIYTIMTVFTLVHHCRSGKKWEIWVTEKTMLSDMDNRDSRGLSKTENPS